MKHVEFWENKEFLNHENLVTRFESLNSDTVMSNISF